jgi:hypothetical protein
MRPTRCRTLPICSHSPPARDDDDIIVPAYGPSTGGIIQYDLLAGDVYRLSRLRWVMLTSLARFWSRGYALPIP